MRKGIPHTVNNDLFSLAIYSKDHFTNFSPTNEFERWAAVEVSDFGNVSAPLEPLVLEGGLYAVFKYKGSSNDHSIFQYIYGAWIPASPYELDDRPHFEVLGKDYRTNDPNSEEEIWIPVKHQ